MAKNTTQSYLAPILNDAFDVLELSQAENQSMSLEVFHRHIRLPKSIVAAIVDYRGARRCTSAWSGKVSKDQLTFR